MLLFRLGLPLMRVIENGTDDTWRNVRHELDRMHLDTTETAEGRVAQRSATTPGETKILRTGVPQFVGIFGGPTGHRTWSQRCELSETPKSVGTRLVD